MLEELNSTCKKGTYTSSRLKKFVLRNGFFELEFRKEAKEEGSGFAKPRKSKGNATSQRTANFLGREERSEEFELEKVSKKLIRITVQGIKSRQKKLNK